MDSKSIRIVLYGHATCPGTARARTYFRAHRLAYVWRDIADRAAAAEFAALGAWATPAVVLDGRLIMVGFDRGSFEAALQQPQPEGLDGAKPGA